MHDLLSFFYRRLTIGYRLIITYLLNLKPSPAVGWAVPTLCLLFCFLGLTEYSIAKDYWIAPEGSLSAKGTKDNPIPYRLFETLLSRVSGGSTFIFKPGIYSGPIIVRSEQAGTPQSPTILKSEQKYKAVIHGSLQHGVTVLLGADWVIIDGFEVRCAAIDGVVSNANHTVIRNCWIHNNCENGIGSYGVQDSIYEQNLVEFNGTHIQFTHGLYVHGKNLIIRQNIVRFNASHGIHLYPGLSESLIENNLVYGNIRSGVLIYSLPNGSNNRIINNTIVDNGYGIYIKDGKGDVIANNIISGNIHWRNGVSDHAMELADTKLGDIKFYNNLIYPKTPISEPNNIYLDPQFINPEKGVFFLKPNSPAIKKGSSHVMPNRDFWGRQRAKDIHPDLGCFPFNESVLKEDYRKSWYYGWPFFFKESTGPLPDLWALPSN